MGQSRRPGSGTPRDGHKAMNGIIAPPGAEFAGLPGSKIAAVKAEAIHGNLQAKSGTPPPQEQGAFACQMERHNSQHASAEARGKSPEETPEQQRKREDRLLEQAGAISALRSQLSLAFGRPYPEPARPKTQWDYLIEEMQWLHVDFAQERLWKRAAARTMAMGAAAAARKGSLKRTPAGDKMQAEISKATARESESKSKRERLSNARNATAHIADAPLSCLDLEGIVGPDTPPPRDSRSSLTYFTDETLQDKVERHLHDIVEADVIQRLQEEREWEQEVEDARRAQIESREAKRVKEEADEPAEPAVDDEELALSLRNKRRKKAGRLNTHIMDDFVEMDDSQDGADTPVGMRPGAGRRPTAMLRPLSGTSDRQMSDAEQRAQRKKRARRDFDDEDYEEPAQPRRVSARRQAAAEAQAQARKGMLRGQPSDKRKLNQKGIQRIDSMQFGGLRRGSGMAGSGQSMPWSDAEDRLLCAIVHEFGSNWFLVADVLSASCAMQGIYRSPTTCRYRFRNLTATHGQGVELEPSEEMALAAMQIDKQSARQLLNSSLPVPSDVLMGHQKALAQIATKAHQQRLHEEMRAGQAASMRTEPHPSFQNVMGATLAANKGQFMAPAQLAELAEAQMAAQAAQHAAVQQAAAQQAAAAQAAQAAALPPGAAMAGPPMSPAQLAQQPFAPPMSMGQPLANGTFPNPASALGPPNGPAPGTPGGDPLAQSAAAGQGMPPGAPGQQPPGIAQLPAQPGTPGAMPPGTAGLPAGVPQMPPASGVMPPQHQQQGSQAQLPMGSHAGLPGSPAQLQAPGGPAGLAAQQLRPPQMLQGQPVSQAQQQAAQQRSNAQVAQLQSILAQNQMPDGRVLTDDIRNSIIARLTQAQRAPQRGMQQGLQMTPAALQAAQNAARLHQQQQGGTAQGGPRGLPGMLAGMTPNMAMRPHMGGFPSTPNGMPQMPQVRPQQPGLPSQMMPPGMTPPQMSPGGLPNLPGLLAAQTGAGARPPGSAT
ncbi:g7701 [Coccomyxa viridis]|uniref:G7701 protein n=1 Tax=Coccomyxa viridis TaxID=1274662 RepID=A0ABP1G306_9CHLO